MCSRLHSILHFFIFLLAAGSLAASTDVHEREWSNDRHVSLEDTRSVVRLEPNRETASLPLKFASNHGIEISFKNISLTDVGPPGSPYLALRVRAEIESEEARNAPLLGIFRSQDANLIDKRFIHAGKARFYTFDLSPLLGMNGATASGETRIFLKSLEGFGETGIVTITAMQLLTGRPEVSTLSLSQMVDPFWQTGRVYGETVFPSQAELPLLGEPQSPVRIFDGTRVELIADAHYSVQGRILTLGEALANRLFPNSELFPTELRSPHGRVLNARAGGGILSMEGSWFQERQLSVDYVFDPDTWSGPKPDYQPEQLPRTLRLLESGAPIKIAFYGDSITFGANATAMGGTPPYQWSWSTLMVEALRANFDSKVEFLNASLGGTTADWGAQNAKHHVAPYLPDLVVLAFGMNGRIPPDDFGRMIETMMRDIRESSPEAEFILVHSMLPNETWRSLEPQQNYGAVMQAMQRPGVLFADVWCMHHALIERKRYVDTTGNHVNHPNDFLIRIYAQVVLSRFIQL
jgi:hypothetical protein